MSRTTQTQRILDDLLQGIHVNWLRDIERYGTSCRSRIAELRKKGYKIDDYRPDGRYKVYYIKEENRNNTL